MGSQTTHRPLFIAGEARAKLFIRLGPPLVARGDVATEFLADDTVASS